MSDPVNQAAPARVRNAVSLLWASLAIGFVASFFDSNSITRSVSPAMVYSIMAITTLIMAFFIYKIGQGRNWARITFLVLFLLGLIAYVPALTELFNRSVVAGALGMAQAIMQMTALYLVFSKPGSLWFRKVASPTTA